MAWTEIVGLIAMVIASGGFASLLTELLGRPGWSPRLKWLTSVACAALFGLATMWLSGDVIGLTDKWGNLTAADVAAFLSATYAAASTWYHALLRGTGVMNKLDAAGAPTP